MFPLENVFLKCSQQNFFLFLNVPTRKYILKKLSNSQKYSLVYWSILENAFENILALETIFYQEQGEPFSSSHSQKTRFASYILRKKNARLFLLLAVEVGRSPEVGDFYVPLLVKQDVFGLGLGFRVQGLGFRDLEFFFGLRYAHAQGQKRANIEVKYSQHTGERFLVQR